MVIKKEEAYSVEDIMKQLEASGNPSRRARNVKYGAGELQFGVSMGNLRSYAKKIKQNHSLALDLWKTQNTDARLLSAMLLDAKQLSKEQIVNMVHSITYYWLMDEFIFQGVSKTSFYKELLDEWIVSSEEYIGRAGWSLVSARVVEENVSEDEIRKYLVFIENDMINALPRKQEAMNRALCEIGILNSEFTDQCMSLGERLGVYKELKVPKGCYSPYAPEWITVGIKKKNSKK